MSVTVCVATHGQERWRRLAETRAVPSAHAQGCEVIVVHQPDGNVASARNEAAEQATGSHLVFLDGDDELAPGYVEAMQPFATGTVLAVPLTQYVNGRRVQPPKYWPEVEITHGNWLVIGTLVQREQFLAAGGFHPDIHLYEDWHLFARLWRDGARLERAEQAVYIAHVQQGSRNRSPQPLERFYWHQRIGHDVFPDLYEPTTADEDERRMLTQKRLRFLPRAV